uniref:Uncharacterized protein n=1 Tax=Oryza barthii TaxID=65489 RepID=A0A0D3GQS8_9ORYZ
MAPPLLTRHPTPPTPPPPTSSRHQHLLLLLEISIKFDAVGMVYFIVREKKVVELSRRHSLKAAEATPVQGVECEYTLEKFAVHWQ